MTLTCFAALPALSLLLFSGVPAPDIRTSYGNEWIRYDLPYIRIPVVKTGWYSVSFDVLESAGVPVRDIPMDDYRLFVKGKETALWISPPGTGPGAVEFYGEGNTGAGDSELYISRTAQPHMYYSLYTDTSAYFLTWTKGEPGKRIRKGSMLSDSPPSSLCHWHWKDILLLSTAQYSAGNIYPPGAGYDDGVIHTAYDTGEGWTGPEIVAGDTEGKRITCPGAVADSLHLSALRVLLTGRSAGTHMAEVWAGTPGNDRKLAEGHWTGYQSLLLTARLHMSDFDSARELTITIRNKSPVPAILPPHLRISLGFVHLTYPQYTSAEHELPQQMLRPPRNARISVTDEPAVFFDITDPLHPVQMLPDDGNLTVTGETCILAVRKPLQTGPVRKIVFQRISPATQFFIITHPALRKPLPETGDPVDQYAAYRRSPAGGGYYVTISESWQLYDQFAYGEPGPLGLRRAIRWLHDQGSLQFVFLAGRSIDPQTARLQGSAWTQDLVPNAGWPGSDLPLTWPDSTPVRSASPSVPIGRLPAGQSEDISNYLRKVRDHELQHTGASWRKRIIHLYGGLSSSESARFKSYLADYEQLLVTYLPGLSVVSGNPSEETASRRIPSLLSEGVALLTVFGHSGLSETDTGLGLASEPAHGYPRTDRYPVVIANGCALGNVFFRSPALGGDWVLTPEKGAVLFLAHTHNGLFASLHRYTGFIYETLSDTAFTKLPFGTIQREAIRRYLIRYPSLTDLITAQQVILLGDPAVRIFPADMPLPLLSDSSAAAEAGGTEITSPLPVLKIRGAYPNPADHQVEFGIEAAGYTEGMTWDVDIYDLAGRKISALSRRILPGKNTLQWAPKGLSAGIYLYRMHFSASFQPDLRIYEEDHRSRGQIIWK